MRSDYSRARAQLEFHILWQCGVLYLSCLGGYRLVVISRIMSSKFDCAATMQSAQNIPRSYTAQTMLLVQGVPFLCK
jgi:hypothetical protein